MRRSRGAPGMVGNARCFLHKGFAAWTAAVVCGLFAGAASASPVWLRDGPARVGLDASSDAGVFAWEYGGDRIDSRLWWWVQVDGGVPRSLDRLQLELDRDGRDEVELESEQFAASLEVELSVWRGAPRDREMGLRQELEIENEVGRSLPVRLLLLSDFGGPAEHPIALPSVGAGPGGVHEWLSGLRVETSFGRAPDRLLRGSAQALIEGFGVPVDEELPAVAAGWLSDAWSAEWWLSLGPYDEIEFVVQTRSVPEPSSSLLLVVGLGLLFALPSKRV